MIHIHFPLEPDADSVPQVDGIVIGSVFCDNCRIDRAISGWDQFIDRFRRLNHDAKIYVQQPFYLMNGMEREFLKILDTLSAKGNIDGVLVNSAGMALEVSRLPNGRQLHQVFSRFGIHKRRRTNHYLLEQLWECGVKTLECFDTDSPLMEDLITIIKTRPDMELWLRVGVNVFHSFSRSCFVELYNGYCVEDPDSCASGRFKLNNDKKNINLTTSGHFIYSGPVPEKIAVPPACSAIVVNIRENEL